MRAAIRPVAAAVLLTAGGTLLLATNDPLLAQEQAAAEAPRVLRGSGLLPAKVPDPAAMAPRFEVAAGDELWLIDRAGGELIACELGPTTQVSQQTIRCWADDLPGRLSD